jgi:exodeoxyribonuclease-3
VLVASWNINSVRSRLPRVLAFLARWQPDVLCLQEIKTETHLFPFAELWSFGYAAAVFGQRNYNGVAIVARRPISDVFLGLGDEVDDREARLVSATVGGARILCAYVPNGQIVGEAMYRHKLDWMRRLRGHLDRYYRPDQPLLLAGDFNVAPESRDVHDPKYWSTRTHFHIDSRVELRAIAAFGLIDTFRLHHAEAGAYTWWDYRAASFRRDHGLRLDFVFATRPIAERCFFTAIDRAERGTEHTSDHAPILAAYQDSST